MFPKDDIVIEFYRASGPGGQRKNKKDTAVRITHVPTGITVVAPESRYRSVNMKRALERLTERIRERTTKAAVRVRTPTPRRVNERRLESKRITAAKKDFRRRIDDDQ
jgi:protein subunit release factor B